MKKSTKVVQIVLFQFVKNDKDIKGLLYYILNWTLRRNVPVVEILKSPKCSFLLFISICNFRHYASIITNHSEWKVLFNCPMNFFLSLGTSNMVKLNSNIKCWIFSFAPCGENLYFNKIYSSYNNCKKTLKIWYYFYWLT